MLLKWHVSCTAPDRMALQWVMKTTKNITATIYRASVKVVKWDATVCSLLPLGKRYRSIHCPVELFCDPPKIVRSQPGIPGQITRTVTQRHLSALSLLARKVPKYNGPISAPDAALKLPWFSLFNWIWHLSAYYSPFTVKNKFSLPTGQWQQLH